MVDKNPFPIVGLVNMANVNVRAWLNDKCIHKKTQEKHGRRDLRAKMTGQGKMFPLQIRKGLRSIKIKRNLPKLMTIKNSFGLQSPIRPRNGGAQR